MAYESVYKTKFNTDPTKPLVDPLPYERFDITLHSLAPRRQGRLTGITDAEPQPLTIKDYIWTFFGLIVLFIIGYILTLPLTVGMMKH